MERAVAGTVAAFGGIDVVVANAGIATRAQGVRPASEPAPASRLPP
jgi:NAD(P)-dependent dehydrogenase (short-subunit alcohol dehydrogenase family)